MKKNLLLIFICATSVLFAQKSKKNEGVNFHWVSEQYGIGPVGGQFHPDLHAVNSQMDSLGAKSNFFEGLRGYGLTVVEPLPVIRGGGFDAAFAFNYMTKYTVNIGKVNKDSLTYAMSGWNLMTSVFGKDVIPGQIVALVLAPGFNWGSLKMVRTLGGDGTLFRNFYIAPMARAELRFVFGPVILGARGMYRYDLTSDEWKLKKGPAATIPGVKNTGFSIEFFVGYGHVHVQ